MGLNGGGAEAGLQETQHPRTENTGTQTEDLASCFNCRNTSLNESGILLVIPQKKGDENIQDFRFVRTIAVNESEIMQLAEEKNWRIAIINNVMLAASKQATPAPMVAPYHETISPRPAHGVNTTVAAIPNYPSAEDLRTQGNKRAKEQEQQGRQEQERIPLDLQIENRARVRAQEARMSRLRREEDMQRLIKGMRRRQMRLAAWERWRHRRFYEMQIQTIYDDLNRERDLFREELLRMQKKKSEQENISQVSENHVS